VRKQYQGKNQRKISDKIWEFEEDRKLAKRKEGVPKNFDKLRIETHFIIK
jgi:hypothetical protein